MATGFQIRRAAPRNARGSSSESELEEEDDDGEGFRAVPEYFAPLAAAWEEIRDEAEFLLATDPAALISWGEPDDEWPEVADDEQPVHDRHRRRRVGVESMPGYIQTHWDVLKLEEPVNRFGGADAPAPPAGPHLEHHGWSMVGLRAFGADFTANLSRCPRTAALLEALDGAVVRDDERCRGRSTARHHGRILGAGARRAHLPTQGKTAKKGRLSRSFKTAPFFSKMCLSLRSSQTKSQHNRR